MFNHADDLFWIEDPLPTPMQRERIKQPRRMKREKYDGDGKRPEPAQSRHINHPVNFRKTHRG